MLSLRKVWLRPHLPTGAWHRSCSGGKLKPGVMAQLITGYKNLIVSDSKSLLKKHLTQEIFDKLKSKVTPTFHSSLLDCIQSGLCNVDSGVGIYAPDPEAYTVFADLFDPIIEDYHRGFKKTDKHPEPCFGSGKDFENLDPRNEFIVSTRVRCGRSVQCFPFNPCMTEFEYCELEGMISNALGCLRGQYSGSYMPLAGMQKETQEELINQHFLFKEGDRFLQAANASRFWPAGRGIYFNCDKNFLVWVNEEDHIRVISMEKGGDLGKVYDRMIGGVETLGKFLQFSHDKRLGFLTFCPTNLGTTIRASVHIKLPSLAADKAKLEAIASEHKLQVRGTRGEHTEAEGGIYDISNKRRMGLTEYEAVREMYEGIKALIEAERKLGSARK
ncbi:arginine kinase-like [Scaptodrosophila lebanonensis]|uniref:arginine kinase n=1 Tax=Drosophila lebanonensis TaxID=7225 RepID=A0A6J2TBJ5_DROLE|nr:arginine kinase-like [Scaptodrosophila lebanonensis]